MALGSKFMGLACGHYVNRFHPYPKKLAPLLQQSCKGRETAFLGWTYLYCLFVEETDATSVCQSEARGLQG